MFGPLSTVGKFKVAGIFFGTFAAAFGAITAFTPAIEAWDASGFPTLATRNFVRAESNTIKMGQSKIETTQQQTTKQITELSIGLAITARNRLERDRLKEIDPDAKLKIEQEMRRIDDEIDTLKRQR